jgi:hypothetical protein
MAKWIRHLVIASIIIVIGLHGIPLPSHAQEGDNFGLTEAEIIQVERLYDVLNRHTTFDSYQVTTREQDVQEFRYFLPGQSAVIVTGTLATVNTTAIREDDSYAAMSTLTFEFQEDDATNQTNYAMEAELRAVDDQLYIKGDYTERNGELPDTPPDWVQWNAEEEPPAFVDLNLSRYLSDAFPVADINIIKQALDTIQTSGETLEDGTPVDRIQATFTGEGFISMFRALQNTANEVGQDSPLLQAIFNNMEDATRIQIIALVDRENTPLQVGWDISLVTGEIDLTTVDGERFDEGSLLLVRLRVLRSRKLEDFNMDDVEPIIAPSPNGE